MAEMAKPGEVLTFPLDTNAANNNAQLMISAKAAQEKGRQRRSTKAKKQQAEVHDVHMEEEQKEEPCNKNKKGKDGNYNQLPMWILIFIRSFKDT